MTQEEDDAKLVADVNAMAKKVWGLSFDEFLDTPAGRALTELEEAKPREQRLKEREARLRALEEIGRKQDEWDAISKEEQAEHLEEHKQWLKDVWYGKLPKK